MSTTTTAERAGPGDWAADLALGAGFAVRARRSSWGRLTLTAIGIALGVLVLVTAASVPHVIDAHAVRTDRVQFQPVHAGTAGAVRRRSQVTAFRGDDIDVTYVQPTDHDPAVPPGLVHLPEPGAAVVSPALLRLLTGPDGSLLRPRFPRVTGTIGKHGLVGPSDLRAYVGARDLPADEVTLFHGTTSTAHSLPPLLWVLLVLGVVVMLVPVVVFVAASARLSSAARDRRLAALRLLGGSARQVRRIAAGEALLGAAAGLALGAGAFFALRPLVESQQIAGVSVFPSDVVPGAPLLVLIVAIVPAITVGAVLFALRDTVIDPLGVVRHATPPRRRLWWRLAVPVLGGLVLLRAHANQTALIAGGVVLLLSAVPLLLPWILQRVVALLRRGTPSWELATSRLALDSGTPSRVVSGVAVVLTGAIALFGLLLSAQRSIGGGTPAYASDRVHVHAELSGTSRRQVRQAVSALAATAGIGHAGALDTYYVPGRNVGVLRGTCEALRAVAHLRSCRDGDVFRTPGGPSWSGQSVRVQDGSTGRLFRWRVPSGPLKVAWHPSGDAQGSDLLVTPAAMRHGSADGTWAQLIGSIEPGRPDVVERVRDALAPLSWRVEYVGTDAPVSLSQDARSLDTIRRGLSIGALITLALAGASMLVLAIEQIRDRRGPLASLSASGVPRSMLARSVLWQNAIPVLLAVVISTGTGLLLGALTLRIAGQPVSFDAANVAALAGAAIAVVAVATVLTLPAVRQATRPTTLREE